MNELSFRFLSRSPVARAAALLALTTLAAALSACGGGGGGAATAVADDPSADTDLESAAAAGGTASATAAAADAVVLGADAAAAVETAVQTTRTLVKAAAASGATATVPRACPGGGSATLSISGGSAASVLNGRLDAGEVYVLAFDQCRGAKAAARVDGSATLTVVSATSSSWSVRLQAQTLSVSTSTSGATLDGQLDYRRGSETKDDGSVVATGRTTADAITLGTRRNGNTSQFTLGDVDLTRTVTTQGGTRVSTTVSGQHGVDATVRGVRHQYTVATEGSAAYSASGVPTTGHWKITTDQAWIDVTLAAPYATITVDEGQDGSLDRSRTLTIRKLLKAAG